MTIFWRRFGLCLLFLFICTLLFIGFLPTILSTPSGKKFALSVTNKLIKGHLEIDTLSLHWIGSQKIGGFRYTDDSKNEILSFDSLASEASLLKLAFGSRDLKKTTLLHPHLFIKREEKKEGSKENSTRKRSNELSKWRGDITIQDGTLRLSSPQVQLTDFNLHYDSKSSGLRVQSKASYLGKSGSISICGVLKKPLNITAEIKNLSVELLDGFYDTSIFTASLGPTLDLTLNLEEKSDKIVASLTVASQNLNGKLSGYTADQIFHIDQASLLHFWFTPALFSSLVEDKAWVLANKSEIVLQINSLSYPIDLEKLDFSKIPLKATITTERAELMNEKIGNFSLNNFGAYFSTDQGELHFNYSGNIQSAKGSTDISGVIDVDDKRDMKYQGDVKNFPMQLVELFSPRAALLPHIVGNIGNLKFVGTRKNKKIDLNFTLESDRCNLSGKCRGSSSQNLRLELLSNCKTPVRFTQYIGDTYEIDLDMDLSLCRGDLALPSIQGRLKSSVLDLSLKGQGGRPCQPFDYRTLNLTLSGTITNPPITQGSFEEGKISIKLEGEKNLIIAHITSKSIGASARVENFIQEGSVDFQKAGYLIKADSENFPVVLLNLVTSPDLPLTTLFGESLDFHFEGKKEASAAQFSLKANGEGINATLSAHFDGALSIPENKPASIRWEINEERYTALMKLLSDEKIPFQLEKTAVLEMDIHNFSCPTPIPESLNRLFCQSGFVGAFSIYDIAFYDSKTKERMLIPEISGEIRGEDFSKEIKLSLNGAIHSQVVPENSLSDFKLALEMFDFWKESGKINREKMRVKGSLDLNLIPVRSVLGTLPIKGETRQKIFALLGDLVNGRIYGEIQELSGPLTIDFKSTNFKALLPMQLDKGILFLRQAVETELTLTPLVSETFLKDVYPLIITGAWSDHPIKLYVDAQGFSVPLRHFSLDSVLVSNAVIDFGKIYVQNGGQIQKLVTFLKAEEISPEGVMEAWFTPIYMSLKNGVANYQRFDLLLANKIHIAFWGHVNLIDDHVNMVLAIGSDTIKERFKIAGLKSNDLFQVPMTGTTSKVDLDWSAATSRIGLLVASNAAGGIGAIIGGIIENITGLGPEPSPPPTTQPFPWEHSH